MSNVSRYPHRNRNQAGFSLVQISVILTVAAIIGVALLPEADISGALRKQDVTMQRLIAIEQAMRHYRAGLNANNTIYNQSGRLPCPADGAQAITSNTFGMEVGNPGACAPGGAAMLGPTTNVVAGVVPVRSLKLPDETMFDGWGRRFTYAVDVRATQGKVRLPNALATTAGSATVVVTHTAHGIPTASTVYISGASAVGGIAAGNLNGTRVITVINANSYSFPAGALAAATVAAGGGTALDIAPTLDGANRLSCYALTAGSVAGAISVTVKGRFAESSTVNPYVLLISHGPNGHGAFPAGGSTVAGRLNAGSTDADERDNGSVNGAFAASFDANFVQDVQNTTFDDIVRYGLKCQ